MSAITGDGWGSAHNWKRGETTTGRMTWYRCLDCGCTFGHHYPSIPDIFSAMKFKEVPKACPGPSSATPSTGGTDGE